MLDIIERSQLDDAKMPLKKWARPELVDVDGEIEAAVGPASEGLDLVTS